MRAALVAALATLLFGCGTPPLALPPGPADAPQGPWRQQTYAIPMRDADGAMRMLLSRVCRPEGDGPARLVVIAHGSPPVAADRAKFRLLNCDDEAPRWFLQRGFVVAEALRRGYGGTGGPYLESSSDCSAPSYERSARESARDLQAVVDYATALPFVRPDGATLVGQSAGGWATLGMDSLPHPKLMALVSMAGGRGGHAGNVADRNCKPENLAAAAGALGRSATTPMLWIYTENDSFFAPPIARAIYDAFTASGGQAEFHQLGPFANDGHRLFFGRGGSAVWGPLMERYLHGRGVF